MSEAAVSVVFNKEKTKILVTQRRDVAIWVLPGGGIEKGEKPEKAAIREVFEETGVRVAIRRKVAELTPINLLGNKTHLFECEAVGGEPGNSEESTQAAFYPIHQLPDLFFLLHRYWIEMALENRAEMIQAPIQQLTYYNLAKFFLRHPLHTLRFLCAKIGLPINARALHAPHRRRDL